MESNALLESEALHARARAFVHAFDSTAAAGPALALPEAFDALACDLARYQHAHVEGYRRLLSARGVDPNAIRSQADAPAVPTDAFKLARVSAFTPAETPIVFRTSGTTGQSMASRGSHFFRDVATYDAAALAFGKWALMQGLSPRTRVVVLGPSPALMPDSSLTHMLALFAGAFEPSKNEQTFFLEGDVFDVAGLDEVVASATVEGAPVLLLATSFALVHFLDALGDDVFRLPTGSRVMQTGGFKGRSREVSAPELRRAVSETFGIPEGSIVSEYGMTELSSQFYEATLHGGPHGVYVEPPWANVVAVDPETLEPVKDGEPGIARIVDLMNVDSAAFVLTADRVRRVRCSAAPSGTGFELLGRAPGATPRGCSLAIDDFFSKPS